MSELCCSRLALEWCIVDGAVVALVLDSADDYLRRRYDCLVYPRSGDSVAHHCWVSLIATAMVDLLLMLFAHTGVVRSSLLPSMH